MSNDITQRTAGEGSVSRFWRLLELALKEHQTWFFLDPANSSILLFPFAWYLDRGMELINRDTKARYKIKAVFERQYVISGHGTVPVQAALIEGANPPKAHHRVSFPEDRYIVFRPANARSWEANAQFDNTNTEEYGAWNDTITYVLRRREPGTVDARPFGRHREMRPRFRERIFNDNDLLTATEFKGQVFDNVAQFDCWAQTATQADLLSDYFEKFMSLWTGVIEYNGIERIWYEGRGMDVLETSWRNDIYARGMQYFFRTEHVLTEVYQLIRAIDLAVRVADTLESAATTGIPITGVLRAEIQENEDS